MSTGWPAYFYTHPQDLGLGTMSREGRNTEAPRLRTKRLHRPSSLGGGFVHHAFSLHMSLASSTLRAKVVSAPPVVSRKGQTIFTCSVLSMVLVPMTFSPLPDKPRVSQADRSNRGGALGAIARR